MHPGFHMTRDPNSNPDHNPKPRSHLNPYPNPQDIRGRGADRFLFLSSSAIIRTPDWFLLRNFADVGPAHLQPELLPPAKFAAIDPAASCRLFVKEIVAPDATSARVPAGKRIGF